MCLDVFVVGCLTGIVASIIDIGAQWMTDLRYGLCVGSSPNMSDGPQLWFGKEQCCWANEGKFDSQEGCDQWRSWSEIIGKQSLHFMTSRAL